MGCQGVAYCTLRGCATHHVQKWELLRRWGHHMHACCRERVHVWHHARCRERVHDWPSCHRSTAHDLDEREEGVTISDLKIIRVPDVFLERSEKSEKEKGKEGTATLHTFHRSGCFCVGRGGGTMLVASNMIGLRAAA